jgi:shikimate dehydrogenase
MERLDDRATSRGDTGLRLTGATQILGLIANPVAQARSPAMANALLRDWGRLGEFVLVPFQVPAGALDGAIAALRHVGNFAGAIVSMPHKCAILPMLDELTPQARLVEAVNVIRRSPDGRLVGTVMDGEGLVAGLRSTGHDAQGASCLLVGAGGAASAIAFALAAHGCQSLTIVNRTAARAASLAARVGAAFPAVLVRAGDPGDRYDVAINATSLGMRPDDALPISSEVVERAALIAECVIAPERTRLLEIATAKGRAIQTGVPMLAAQMELMLRFMGVE